MKTPTIIIIGGPNGAGKSTIGPLLIERAFGGVEFVDADVIARGLSGLDPDRQSFAAGRIMLQHIHRLAASRRSFAFETTLASRTFAPLLRRMIADGYRLHLVYIWVRSAKIALQRVRARIAAGGHSVAAETVIRRFKRSAHNLFHLYLPLAAAWEVLDNSNPGEPTLVATGGIEEDTIVHAQAVWDLLKELGDVARS